MKYQNATDLDFKTALHIDLDYFDPIYRCHFKLQSFFL